MIGVAARSLVESLGQLDIYNFSCREDKQPNIHKSEKEKQPDESKARERRRHGELTQKLDCQFRTRLLFEVNIHHVHVHLCQTAHILYRLFIDRNQWYG